MISMLIISRVYYRQAKDYLVYFVMAALYGMILPFIFLLTGKVRIVFPSVISIGMGVLMLIGLVLFKGKEMRDMNIITRAPSEFIRIRFMYGAVLHFALSVTLWMENLSRNTLTCLQ